MTEQVFDTEGLMGEAVDLSASANEVRLARLEVIARLDSSSGYAYDGFTSASTFLVSRCGLGVGEANREVFLARSLADMPYATKLAAAGGLTINQLEALAHARSRHPQPYAAQEPTLAEAASGLSLRDTRRLLDYWAQAHDEPDDGHDNDPSRLHLSKTWRGRGRLDGDLDPELLTLFDTALNPLVSELVNSMPRQDLPARSQLRAQALAEILRRHLDSADTPTDHGNRPNITVVVDWDTLTGTDLAGTCEFGDGTIITPATAQRLACDAKVCRLLTGPKSEILDLGRSRRTVSTTQWRALRVRDRHCQFPHCRRPWYWTDAHHLTPWSQGGETNLDQLVLLCRHHHTLVHEGGWSIKGTVGTLIFTRPDRTTLSTEPP